MMMKPVIALPLIVGIPLSLIAATMAFVITYEEYTRHFPDRKEPWRHAIKTAIFAFVFFLALTVLVTKLLIR
jgi:uncharacterized BrkB/YihY/UPF0761 family membrane protein